MLHSISVDFELCSLNTPLVDLVSADQEPFCSSPPYRAPGLAASCQLPSTTPYSFSLSLSRRSSYIIDFWVLFVLFIDPSCSTPSILRRLVSGASTGCPFGDKSPTLLTPPPPRSHRPIRSAAIPSPPLPSLQWSTVRSFPSCSPAQSARFLNSPPLAPKVPLLHLVR